MSRHKYKTKLIPYRDLRDGYVFRRKERGDQGGRLYTKVCDAFSIDMRTDKDAIFLHHELVEPLYPNGNMEKVL
jgi:hypothetical protein